jgi:RNA polymerase sigma-70 factor (ECF subfamily)
LTARRPRAQRPPADDASARLLRASVSSPAVFASFYLRHAEDVLAYFTRRTFDPETALELTAETFAQAFASRHRFRGTSGAEALGWLYAIARHQLARYIRKGKSEKRALQRLGVQQPSASDEDITRIERLAALPQLRALLARELGRLSEGQREAIQLRVVDGLSYPELARQLAVSEEVARSRVSRGLRELLFALEGSRAEIDDALG